MSIAIALIPLALPAIPVLIGLRLVLGKQGFQRLIDSMQVKLPTSFSDKDDLARAVAAAGYDLKPWPGGFKTHFPGSMNFLTWEFDGQIWFAVFAKGVSQEMVATFIRSLEAKAGHSIFNATGNESDASIHSEPIPTNFRDEALLVKTLADAGTLPHRDSIGNLTCSVGQSTLRFVRARGEPYNVEFQSTANREQLVKYLMSLDEDYKRCVQADTYEHLKARIAAKNLTVESEEVLEDNSIVLTLVVQE